LPHYEAAKARWDRVRAQVDAIKPKAFRPPKDWANRTEMSRISLSVLQQAAEPLATRDIAMLWKIAR
jgi:hypothetical protein